MALLSVAACLTAHAADAQQQLYVYAPGSNRPSVIVDLSVLDKLGPEPTLPSLLRSPREGTTSSSPQSSLLPPPSSPPQSTLSLPSGLMAKQTPAAPRTAATPPPPPSSMPAMPAMPDKLASVPPRPATAPPEPPAEMPAAPETPKLTPPPAPRITAPAPSAAVPKPAAPRPTPKVARPAAPPPPPPPTVPTPSVAETPKPAEDIQTPKPVASMPDMPAVPSVPAPPEPADIPQASAPAIAAPPPPPPPSLATPTPQVASRTQPTETGPNGTISISFAAESSDLPASATAPLDQLIAKMKDDDNIRVRLNGYASATSDSPSQARRISLFRALSVRTYMMKNGIRSTRIDIHALGNRSDQGDQDKVEVLIRNS